MDYEKIDEKLFDYDQIYEDYWHEEERIFDRFEKRLEILINSCYSKFSWYFKKEQILYLKNLSSHKDLSRICKAFNEWSEYLKDFGEYIYMPMTFAKKYKLDLIGLPLFQKTRKFCLMWKNRLKKYKPNFSYDEYQLEYYKKEENVFSRYCQFLEELSDFFCYIEYEYTQYSHSGEIADGTIIFKNFANTLKYLDKNVQVYKKKKRRSLFENSKKNLDDFLEK